MWGNSSTIPTDMNLVSGTAWVLFPLNLGNVTVSPTVGAGIGYRWQDNQDDTVYVLGAGLVFPVAANVDLNVRYRYVADFDGRQADHIIGTGVTFRF
jgi:opacity protein-like surface antigen